MKKVFSFLRSMRFGMILLVLVMLCSLAGSLIPQGEQDMTYVRSYGASAAVTLVIASNDIGTPPYVHWTLPQNPSAGVQILLENQHS